MNRLIIAAAIAVAIAWPLLADAAMCAYMAPTLWQQIVAVLSK